jgi:hypothetical protein
MCHMFSAFQQCKKQILIVKLSEYFLFLVLENFARCHMGSVSGAHKQVPTDNTT